MNPSVGIRSNKQHGVTPFFFGQHKLLNILYIPKLRDLPQDHIDLKGIVFDFGFNGGQGAGLAPFEVQKRNYVVDRSVLLWGLSGITTDLTNPRVGYLVQIFATHGGTQRQFFTKHLNDAEIVGTGQRPFLLRSPYLLMKGDQLQCEVKNLSNNQANPGTANSKVQLVLWGGEFD